MPHIIDTVKKLMRLRAEIRAELLQQEDFPTRGKGSLDALELEGIVSNYVVAAANLEVADTIDQVGADHT